MGRKRHGSNRGAGRGEEPGTPSSKGSSKKQKIMSRPSFLTKPIDYETLDLFQLMAEVAVSGFFTIEQMIELCYSYGVEHGKLVSKNLSRPDHRYPPKLLVTELNDSFLSTSNSPTSSYTFDTFNQTTAKDEVIENGNSDQKQNGNQQKDVPQNGFQWNNRTRNSQKPKPEEGGNSPIPATTNTPGKIHQSEKKYKGVNPVIGLSSTRKATETKPQKFEAVIELFNRKIKVGEFSNQLDAAQAHDRAIIRAIGPSKCEDDQLNFNIQRYSKDPMELFSCFDTVLRQELFGTEWRGVEDCDFSFLLLTFPKYDEMKRKRISKYSR